MSTASDLRKALAEVERRNAINKRIADGDPTEKCGGCSRTTLCPWVVVVAAEKSAPGAVKGVTGYWAQAPICDDCHENPPGTIKGHFFDKKDAAAALRQAGSPTIGG